jgi:2-polyprenyl-3-methyl-5-hydroxy-6-metoxy-1,4-benzoquinol methylase
MIIKKIRFIFEEVYKKKSLYPLLSAFELLIYKLFKLSSLRSAVREQNLETLLPKLKEISDDYFNHYNHVKIEGEYWNYKVRALHAFQTDFTLKGIEIVKKNLKKDTLSIVDIGDSSGTHTSYLKKLVTETNLKLLSVNLDPKAIEKIKKKGYEAILSRAEDLEKHNVNPDLFISFQTIEHLNSPINFLKSISHNTSCEYFLMTLPYLSESRIGLEHIRNNSSENVHAENIHIFELKPSDWKLLFKHTGWEVLEDRIFLQYPKKHPLRILKSGWAKYDFEGFYGVILKRNLIWSKKYLDWQ